MESTNILNLKNAVIHYEKKHPRFIVNDLNKQDLYPRYIFVDLSFFSKICYEVGLNPLKINTFEGYKLKKIRRLTTPTGKRTDFIMPLTKWR